MSRNGSAATHYDAIVFGSGASGLTCATTLAKYGARTLLAEKNPWYGGYAHGFGKDGFYWDRGGIAKVFMAMERMIDEVDLLVPSFRVAARPGQRKLIDPVLEQFQRPWL